VLRSTMSAAAALAALWACLAGAVVVGGCAGAGAAACAKSEVCAASRVAAASTRERVTSFMSILPWDECTDYSAPDGCLHKPRTTDLLERRVDLLAIGTVSPYFACLDRGRSA